MNALRDAEQKVAFLNYLNTFLLSVATAILTIVLIAVDNIKTGQENVAGEISRMKTVEEKTVEDVKDHDARIHALETTVVKETHDWVESNFVRKPQR